MRQTTPDISIVCAFSFTNLTAVYHSQRVNANLYTLFYILRIAVTEMFCARCISEFVSIKRHLTWHLPQFYCIVLYCIVLYCIVLYCIVLYCIVLYCIVLYCIVLYCIVLCPEIPNVYNLMYHGLLVYFW